MRVYFTADPADLESDLRATETCSSRGVPAGMVEVEHCEEPAVLCSRVDWDGHEDRPASFCDGCRQDRIFWGDKDLRVPDLEAGVLRFPFVREILVSSH